MRLHPGDERYRVSQRGTVGIHAPDTEDRCYTNGQWGLRGHLVRAERFHRIDARSAIGGEQHCEQQCGAQHSQCRDPRKRIARVDPEELCFKNSRPGPREGASQNGAHYDPAPGFVHDLA